MQVMLELWMLALIVAAIVVAAIAALAWGNAKRLALRQELASQRESLAALAAGLAAAEERLASVNSDLGSHATNQTRLGAEIARVLERTESENARIERILASQSNTSKTIDKIKDYQKQTFADLYGRSNAHDATLKTLDATVSRLPAEIERLAGNQSNTSSTIDKIKEHQRDALTDLYNRANTLRKDLDNPDARIAALERYMSRNSSVNTVNFRAHNRNLSTDLIGDIIERFAKPLGLDYTANTLAYLAHQMCLLEDRCLGRLGTTIETAVVRALAVQSRFHQPARDVNLIEIGTLFGVAAGAIDISCRTLPGTLRLTLIDPLTGYYGNNEPDIITGVAVNKANLEENLVRIGCRERTTIIDRLAETPEAMAAVPMEFADVLIIDGDHSYEGVKRDYDNYAPRTRPDGLILFDDYDTTAWPDIKPYVDGLLAEDPGLEMVASGYRTAIVRRRAA